ncbi:hypothetical protein HYU95_05365 [Candidatus Daviesbacteria bacterium]|nr:hypothetical protein [Candidatus Daviesbacteria bacterium]
MVEGDFKLKSVPEKLILAYQARQNFAEALKVAEGLMDIPSQRALYGHIGAEQARLGINPSKAIDYLAKLPQNSDENLREKGVMYPRQERLVARYSMAEIMMKLGQVDTAFNLTDPMNGALHPNLFGFDLRLARKMFSLGKNPQPALDRALGNVGLWGGGYYDGEVVLSKHLYVPGHTDLSKTYFDTGKDYQSLLAKTLDLANREQDKDYWANNFSHLSQAYAYCDDLESAWKMVARINEVKNKKYAKKTQNEALEKIAWERLEKKDVEGAIMTAIKTKDKLLMAEVHTEAACVDPENGEKFFREARRYRRRLSKKYKPDEVVVLDSIVGRAAVALGKDGSYFFNRALARASILDAYDRVFAYDGIAGNLALSNLDATSSWYLCYAAAEEYLDESKDQSSSLNDMLAIAKYSMDMEDVAKHQAECGYFALAKETVEKIIAVEGEEFTVSIPFKGQIITDIAAKQGREGLSNREITDLPKEDIRAMLAGNNDLAKEALRYFGLNRLG